MGPVPGEILLHVCIPFVLGISTPLSTLSTFATSTRLMYRHRQTQHGLIPAQGFYTDFPLVVSDVHYRVVDVQYQ